MGLKDYTSGSRVARGLEKAEFVLKNANIVNVFTEEIIHADIAVLDGTIVGIGNYAGQEEVDAEGKYVCPGFIDSHLHLESTLVTPAELVVQAALCGTTTFIVDPHESANVCGLAGIQYIIDQTEEVPANVLVMMPSCVPATSFDDNGCVLTAEKMKTYLSDPRILGLGEVMDCKSVVEGDASMHKKLSLFSGRVCDGHAPLLSDGDLAAYVLAGISTDHECTDFDYARKERRNGMTVLIREGSAARNLEAIVKGIVENQMDTQGFCFCTDDKHIEDIQRDGHINYNIRKSVSLGVDPVKAIQMATIQAADKYGLKGLGAVAPGYQADFIVLNDLKEFRPDAVYYKGKKLTTDPECPIRPCRQELRQTIHCQGITKEDLRITVCGNCHVIGMEAGQITTKDIFCKVQEDGEFVANAEYQKIAVVERHKGTGKISVAIVTGFGLHGGAIASSVSHDSHNIIVVGDNDKDMIEAVEELRRSQGGYTIVSNGKAVETLPLPVMGLMSDAGYEKVNAKLKSMIQKAHAMGVPKDMEPFITLSFMALPVIPEIRITAGGLLSVTRGKYITI